MSRKRYRGCSPVEAEVLRKETRQEIRRLAVVKGAEASVNGRVRHALTPSDLADLEALDRRSDVARAVPRSPSSPKPTREVPKWRVTKEDTSTRGR
jgi:hypothetical protein